MLFAYLLVGFIFFNIWAITTMSGDRGGLVTILLCFLMSLVWPLSLLLIAILYFCYGKSVGDLLDGE